MSVMKRDLNFMFLILIIVTLMMFVGFSTFYQMKFYNLTEDYRTKLAQLEKVSTELQLSRSILNETSVELEVREERASDLQGKYDKLRDEKEKIEGERNRLESELNIARRDLADKIAKVVQLESDVAAKVLEIAAKAAQIASLQTDLNDCEEDYDICKDDLAACQG